MEKNWKKHPENVVMYFIIIYYHNKILFLNHKIN